MPSRCDQAIASKTDNRHSVSSMKRALKAGHGSKSCASLASSALPSPSRRLICWFMWKDAWPVRFNASSADGLGPHGLRVGEFTQAEVRQFPAVAALLDAAHRNAGVRSGVAVDEH